MKKSILSNTILLTGSLLLLTVECNCPANEKKKLGQGNNTAKHQNTAQNTSNQLNKGTQKDGESIAATGNQCSNLNQAGHTTSQVKGLSPEIIKFWNDVAEEDKEVIKQINKLHNYIKLNKDLDTSKGGNANLEQLSNTIKMLKDLTPKQFDAFKTKQIKTIRELKNSAPEEHKKLLLKQEKIFSSLDKKQYLLLSACSMLSLEVIKKTEEIEKALKAKGRIKELPKELNELLELELDKQYQDLLSSLEKDSKDAELVSEIKKNFGKLLKVLDKTIKDNNNDLNQLLSELKEEYNTCFKQQCFNKLQSKLTELKKQQEKQQDISTSKIIESIKISALSVVAMYSHRYVSVFLKDTIQKIEQQSNG